MEEKKSSSREMSSAEWNQLSDEEQLRMDPDRVMHDLIRDEQMYAFSRAGQERDEMLLQEAQITPSRVASPDVTKEMKMVEPEEEEVTEDSSEVNEHNEGQYTPGCLGVSFYNEDEDETHRIPRHLLNVKVTNYFGTHNDDLYLKVERLKEVCYNNRDKIEWIIIYKEIAPTTGHVHYHSIVVLKMKQLCHVCIKIDPRANWERMRGQLKTAYNYVRKDGDKYFEYGLAPDVIVRMLENEEVKSLKRKAPTKTEVLWKELVLKAKAGDESIRNEMLYARYRMYFDDILASVHKDTRFNDDLKSKNLWIYGPPGTGKSKLVWDYAENQGYEIYVKLQNKWWAINP